MPYSTTLVLLGRIPYFLRNIQRRLCITERFMDDLKDDNRNIVQGNDAVRIDWYGGKEGDHGTGRLLSFRVLYN